MFTRPEYNHKWTTVDRVPIDRIQIDKSLFSYQNDVDYGQVLRMLVDFDQELWMPITVNEDYYLLDGQHRLDVAKRLCLEYLDVVMQRGS